MLRSWSAKAAATGMILAGMVGLQGTAHASNGTITDCYFTVTSAGNGMQVLSPGFTTPVATLQTGQVYDLFNTITTRNNIRYWNATSFGEVGDWYPVASTDSSTIYMAKIPSSCSIDNQ